MIIGHFLDKGNRVLLESIKRDILKRLQLKGVDLKNIHVHLKDERDCIKVSVCLNRS
jgi:hypothetical protein